MIEILWKRYYSPGVTGSYHGDMARAYHSMLADTDCDPPTARKMWTAIISHKHLENMPHHTGRKWFHELFPEGGAK